MGYEIIKVKCPNLAKSLKFTDNIGELVDVLIKFEQDFNQGNKVEPKQIMCSAYVSNKCDYNKAPCIYSVWKDIK